MSFWKDTISVQPWMAQLRYNNALQDHAPPTFRSLASKVMTMIHAPPRPGETLKDEVIAPLGLSVAEAAERFGMSHVTLSHVLDGKAAISPGLALQLEQAGVSTARAWLAMQANYDLWCARQKPVS